jgi:hypothetical protein
MAERVTSVFGGHTPCNTRRHISPILEGPGAASVSVPYAGPGVRKGSTPALAGGYQMSDFDH